jgi:predicted permease
MALLTSAGMLISSFQKMRTVNLGFRPDHMLVASYSLPRNAYATQSAVDRFKDELLRAVRQLPGVEAAGIAFLLPAGTDDNDVTMTFEGYIPPKGSALTMATPTGVEGDFFQALGIGLLRGRLFTDADNATSQLVVIVNQKLAEHYWPGQNPIGKRLHRGLAQTTNPWLVVIGEVENVKMGSPDGRTAEQIYQPIKQWIASRPFAAATELSGSTAYIVLRSVVPPATMENSLKAVVENIDSQLPLYQAQTMEQVIANSEAPRRFTTILISSFALVALLLSTLGIYGVTAFSVALREQEMAIRMALGCQRSGILNLILVAGLKLAVIGGTLGLIGAGAMSHVLRSFLFGVSPFDPVVLTLSAVVILLLALASSALPAIRAARINPVSALRGE